MLDEFVTAHRDELIARARARVTSRISPAVSAIELTNGIPAFVDQLGQALRRARSRETVDHGDINRSANQHGQDMLRIGLTIAQVVRDYGDVRQAVTELAVERDVAISGTEFQTLNLCLDDAIAAAVTAYAQQKERALAAQSTERLGILAHEMRNHLNVASLSFESIRTGRVAPSGSTALVHSRSLAGLADLIDRSLAEVRLDAGIEHLEPISVADIIAEVEVSALIRAAARGVHFTTGPVDRTVMIEGDRPILAAALSNLLQNAFKFTKKDSRVELRANVTRDRVRFEIEDECGGLPPGKVDELFQPFSQRGADRSGVGLGLVICRKAAHANAGQLYAHDIPGKGCVFTLDLPRKPPPPLHLVGGRKDEPEDAGASDEALAVDRDRTSKVS